MQRVNVGLIGLGEVAQIIHLPVLRALSDRFAVRSLCDVSPGLLAEMGRRYTVPPERCHADYRALLDDGDLDAVLVLNSDEYHAECTIAALERGCHVLVEKPMCLAPEEARAVVAARDAAGREVMVGYMRRFAPAFVEAVRAMPELGRPDYVRVRDIIGRNQLIIDQAEVVLRPADIPPALAEDRRARAERLVRAAIGPASPILVNAYRLLLGLNSHDLSALRELVGMPRRVLAATTWNDGRYMAVLFEYDGFCAVLETGVDEQVRFDAHIEVYGRSRSLRIQYDTPYIRHLPTTLVVQETSGDAYTQRVLRPTLTDPYTEELKAFHDVVTSGTRPKTSPEDSLEDLALTRAIVDALRAGRGEAEG